MRLCALLWTCPVLILTIQLSSQQYEWRRATTAAPTAGGAGQLAHDTLRKRMRWVVGDQLWLGRMGESRSVERCVAHKSNYGRALWIV